MTGNVAAERFAERLRELKERSGQSFGALARHLHISTSTLHRYCSGAVVPAEYAPVERLARRCGATQEELVDLHRLWLRADALRPAARSASRSAGTRKEREPECSAASDVREPAERERAPEPEQATEQEQEQEQEQVPEPEQEERGAPVPAGRGRRRWPLAAGLAALLVVIVTALNAASSGGSPTDRPPVASSAEAPLTWTARSHVWAGGCGHRYLIDRPAAEVPPPPVAQDAEPWADRLGAVHGDSTIVESTVRTALPGTVVVEAVHIRVVERRAPLEWPVFDMSLGCGGALTPATFAVDLDAERPVARPVAGFDGDTMTELPAPALPFAVTADEPLVLRVEAAAGGCDCSWSVELEWSSGEERGTLVIDEGGEPFRTSGGGEGATHLYGFDTESWRAG
ncbi:helix-turn-helix domain-containing protein [Streptomyces johnsoniae]|uniref:Helix-turn-helix transcriptional regulator n=1 Tax=Streptomyces johnsoniae TaxID=3075532 RepID=A0ABU2SDF4_9ACTN|nr:helix-turn-helix transcriptional regulator [Streptomyces sp. DSM 41886]MDT0445725.1 helix-turn-helix transcriptional regulator [Streptomyces sp. DSM 41886]